MKRDDLVRWLDDTLSVRDFDAGSTTP